MSNTFILKPLLFKIHEKPVVFFLLIAFLFSVSVLGQNNLVPNGDFETFNGCPTALSQLVRAAPWRSPTQGTPDYFNACNNGNNGIVGAPGNNFGSQQPYSGSAYAGFWGVGSDNNREYMSVELTDSMEVGKTYLVEFRYSLADNSGVATDGLQVLFSNYINVGNLGIIQQTPQLSSPSGVPLDDKANWNLFSQPFTASSPYPYMVIGNFKDYSNTYRVSTAGGNIANGKPYFYIDDVSVIEIKDTVITYETNFYLPNAFSPNNDGINDFFQPLFNDSISEYTLTVFNLWGEAIHTTNNPYQPWDGNHKGATIAQGVYPVKVSYRDQNGSPQKKIARVAVIK